MLDTSKFHNHHYIIKYSQIQVLGGRIEDIKKSYNVVARMLIT